MHDNLYKRASETNDTIAAIATPSLGTGGISIIRISGKDSFAITDVIFRSPSGKTLSELPSHTIHYGHIVPADSDDRTDSFIDEVLVSVMHGPRTFTAENTVEINCHGGILVTRRVLEEVLKAGARLAEPGEFTKRAYLNGRIDLAQAEGVIDVINAQNDYTLRASVGQIDGRLSGKIRNLRSSILDHTAFMEAAMDDPEHISMEGHLSGLKRDTEEYISECEKLLKGFDEGRILKEGISTCILGRTNAGKSSLLNLLTGTESAIVTDIAGTTRDTVKESVRMGDIILNLTDTAGIRETGDTVEAMGIKKALAAADSSELIIFVADATETLTEEDKDLFLRVKEKPCIILLNKSDLETTVSHEEASCFFDNKTNPPEIISFSTATGNGMSELEDAVKKKFGLEEIIVNDKPVSVNARHKECLVSAKKSLMLVSEGLEAGLSEDLLCVDLMDAYTYLGLILGEEIQDDLADRIFEKFCMGK